MNFDIALLDRSYGRNTVLEWISSIGIFFICFAGLYIIRKVIYVRLRRWAEKTETEWDDFFVGLLSRTKNIFLFAMSVWIAASFLSISPKAERIIHAVFVFILLVQVALWGREVIKFSLYKALRKRQEHGEPNPDFRSTLGAIEFIVRIVFYSIIVLLTLDNLGFNISALITGLGVGGIAVALAVQNVLGDLFASLSILLDKPFIVGDFIGVGTDTGQVEKIGLKTTRLKSLSGEQLIFSNAELLKGRIRNYKRMNDRRIQFSLSVDYKTPYDQLKIVPSVLKEIIESQPQIRFDHAHLKELAADAIHFEVVYIVLSPDFNLYASIEQNINLEILKRLRSEKIILAYNSGTVWIQNAPAA